MKRYEKKLKNKAKSLKLTTLGFSLIELLAVIVILSIIALIAVPTVMNIITKAQKSAFKNSVYGIIKAGELYYSKKDMIGEELKEVMFEFPNNISDLEINGELPQNGLMIISQEGDIAFAINNGKYCAKKRFDESDFSLTNDIENCSITGILSMCATISSDLEIQKIDNCATSGICEVGTPFAIKVNDEEIYKFYVIGDDGVNVNLIMNKNLIPKIAWNASGLSADGPITAIENLEEVTKDWKNIEAYDYILKDDFSTTSLYGEIPRTNVRARMMTYTELISLGCQNNVVGSCPNWLFENLSASNTNAAPNCYWLPSPSITNSAYSVRFTGKIYPGYVVHDKRFMGVRPVISLKRLSETKVAAKSISVGTEEIHSVINAIYQIDAQILPSNASNKELKWTSSDEKVAIVDQTGKVTIKSEGEATITVQSLENSSIKKVINIIKPFENGIIKSENSCIIEGTCDDGTFVNVQVNDSKNYNFYVIKDTGNELTLIMDQGLGANVKWNESGVNTDGPITALAALETRTSDWTNIDAYDYTLVDDGGGEKYTIERTNVRARLLTYTEATMLGCTKTEGSCKKYLYDNSIQWLSSAASSNNTSAWTVRGIDVANIHDFSATLVRAVRPVITISK